MTHRTWAAALALCGVLLLGLAPGGARAGFRSLSYSTWIVSSDTVILRYMLPVGEAQRLTGAAIPVLTVSKLGEYVLEHTAVFASGEECPAIDQGYDLGKVDPVQAGAGLYGFEIFFRCGAPLRSLVLEDRALFGQTPGHVDFARIEVRGRITQQLFTAGRERLRIEDPAAVPAAGFGAYAVLGSRHILESMDRLCLLLALLLLARDRRELVELLLGLTAGFVLSLLVQATGLVVPQASLLEASVGFLVALCAVAMVLPALRRPRAARVTWSLLLLALAAVAACLRAPRPALLLAGVAGLSAGWLATVDRTGQTSAAGARGDSAQPGIASALRLLPACLLGVLDGFALPVWLAPLQLPKETELRMTMSFDAGVLLTAALGAAMLAGAYVYLLRRGLVLRRPAVNMLLASTLAGLGTFWLVSRL